VYKRTNTSYKPIKHNGVWYSDYKSASSVERVEAFLKLGLPDPVEYADETGPVTWRYVIEEVNKVLEEYTN
jgi:7-cyano-7-deazaguanine synthase